ncbi:unnamed protein product, partial [Callosobruchus maculatus]
MIQDIIGSVTSSKETRTRNKRKNSGDSERKETTARTTKSSKSHTKEGNDKKRRVDSPTDIQRQIRGVGKLEIKSPTERLESDSALDKNENSLCVSDSNKTGSKTNTKSSRRQRTTEQDRNVAASINGDSTGSKSAGKRNAETKSNSCSKMDVECSKRKRRTSCDSVTGGQHNDGSDERKSTKHVGSATSSSESGAERHVTANAEADDKEIRASKRATRQKSREPEPPKASASSSRRRRVSRDSDDGDGTDAAEKTATARKKRRHLHGDLEAITEMDDTAAATAAAAAASASNGDAKLVSRNKRKMESSESKVSEKMPKMDEDDLDNFCGSSSKLAKSKSGKKTAAEGNVSESGTSAVAAAEETATVARTSKRRGGRVSSKNAGAASSAESAADTGDGDSSTPTTPRKAAADLSGSLSTPEKNKRRQKPKVVFTMLDSPQLESFIKHLGGSVVDSVDGCSVLVTETVKRSKKLLVAVGLAKPVCSPAWIRASKDAREFLG